jgi:hypothetical protein
MTDQQEMLVWIMALKPFGFLLILLLIYPARLAVMRFMPESKIKRLLLFRVTNGNDRR